MTERYTFSPRNRKDPITWRFLVENGVPVTHLRTPNDSHNIGPNAESINLRRGDTLYAFVGPLIPPRIEVELNLGDAPKLQTMIFATYFGWLESQLYRSATPPS
jgi:hypothetical protein